MGTGGGKEKKRGRFFFFFFFFFPGRFFPGVFHSLRFPPTSLRTPKGEIEREERGKTLALSFSLSVGPADDDASACPRVRQPARWAQRPPRALRRARTMSGDETSAALLMRPQPRRRRHRAGATFRPHRCLCPRVSRLICVWHPSGRSDGAEDGVCVFAVEVRKGVLNFLFFCFNSITELAQSKEQEKAKMRQRPPPR